MDSEGKIEQTYAWGIECRTNNEVEWTTFLQGLRILVHLNLDKVAISCSSRHVIYIMINGCTLMAR